MEMIVLFNRAGGVVANALHVPNSTPASEIVSSMQGKLRSDLDLIVVTCDKLTDIFPSGQPSAYRVVDGQILPGDQADEIALSTAKQARYAEIDRKTDQLIARGFLYAGLRFSESLEAQSRALGMDQLRNDPLFTYPVTWNSLDDGGVIQLNSADEVHAFVLTGVGYYRQVIDSGTALKAQVRQAVDLASVQAVVDMRV